MTTPTKLNLKIPLPRPDFFHSRRLRQSRLLPTPEEVEPADLEDQQPCEQIQEDPTLEAKEWIESMIRSSGRWDNHLSIIHIDCPHTTDELLELGRLPQPEGVKQCRKMVRAPVIFDEIGCFLWEKLAEMERGPNFKVKDEEQAAEYAREVRTQVTLANLDERFRFDMPRYGSGPKGRAREDSDPVSPTQVRQHAEQQLQQIQQKNHDEQRQKSFPRRAPHNSQTCHFCGHEGICERTEMPEEIRNDSLNATRGRVISRKSGEVQQSQSQNSSPTSSQSQPTGSHALRRHSSSGSSHPSTLLWQREYSSDGSAKAERRRSSFSDRVVHVLDNLGQSLAHGYGYSGKHGRNGSVWSV